VPRPARTGHRRGSTRELARRRDHGRPNYEDQVDLSNPRLLRGDPGSPGRHADGPAFPQTSERRSRSEARPRSSSGG
jgi:hypothetical protein